MTIFRLGRLQFEKMGSEWEVDFGKIQLRKGDPVISIHIPEDGKMENAACREAFEMAKKMFGRDVPYVCHSWLLGAELAGFLEKDTNIMQFQNFFEIVDYDYNIREGEERIFGRLQENPELYAEETSLQRKAKEYLMQGRKLGSGLGILKWESDFICD